MARPVTERVKAVRALLEGRLRDGLHRPGDRFLSNRAVAEQYGLSYQTAQRLLTELVAEGLVVRRHGAGTYVPGGGGEPVGAELLFNVRARRRGSFGANLLGMLRARLGRLGIDAVVRFVDPATAAKQSPVIAERARRFPVIWELPTEVERCAAHQRRAIVLNDRPPGGFPATLIDSICVDDFTGGACAAQMLPDSHRIAVLAGPKGDARSQQRVAGFLSVRRAKVVYADGWFVEHGAARVAQVLAYRPGAVFCGNDRLAEALLRHCEEFDLAPPAVIGFDDAPIASELHLSTIAIPWPEFVGAATRTLAARLAGDQSTASCQVIAPRPVRRS